MADPETPRSDARPEPLTAGEPLQPRMDILTQCVRDVSFENALAQKGRYSGDVTPAVEVQVALDVRKRPEAGNFEIVQKYKIVSKDSGSGETIFVVELDYAGLVAVSGCPEDQLHPFLMIEGPRLMFPFVRQIVSTLTREGGFPQLNVATIDFVALYRREIARRLRERAERDAASAAAAGVTLGGAQPSA